MTPSKPISRRGFLKAATVATSGAILAACAPTAAGPTAKPTLAVSDAERQKWLTGKVSSDTAVKLEIFTWDPSGGDRTLILDLDRFFQSFYPQSSYGTGTSAPWDEYWTKLPTIMAAGTPPDLAWMHFSYVPAFAAKGWMVPLDEYISLKPPDGWPDKWWKASIDTMAYRGVQYAIPWDWAPIVTYINRDVMDPIIGKYPPDDKWTWKELYAAAKEATGPTPDGKQRFGVSLRTYDLGMWALAADFGGRFFNDDMTESTFTQPETVEAFQFAWDALHKDKIMPSSTDMQIFGDEASGFASGLLAMWCTGSDATLAEIFQDVNWGVGPYPMGPAGRHPFEGNVGWFIPKGSRYPDLAYELIAYFHGNPDLARARAVANNQLVARKDQAQWAFESLKDQVPNFFHEAAEIGGENQDHFPVFPGYQEWQQIWTKYVDPLFVEGNPDVEGQLAGLKKETDELLQTGWWTK